MSEMQDDLALKALFADAPRPPMGDEDFVAGVMGRVETYEVRRKSRWQAAGLGALGLTAGVVILNYGDIIGVFNDAFAAYAAQLPAIGAGGSAALIAMAVAAGGWLYAERG